MRHCSFTWNTCHRPLPSRCYAKVSEKRSWNSSSSSNSSNNINARQASSSLSSSSYSSFQACARQFRKGTTRLAATPLRNEQNAYPKRNDVSSLFISESQQRNISKSTPPSATIQQAETSSFSLPSIVPLPFRVGHGFDLHRLEEGVGKLIIGGVEIPHHKGCAAHSDGDVLLHTVTDAILGALCLPDIGQLFPDNDPKWHKQSSDVFLEEAMRLMDVMGYKMGNIDATIILQKPKVSPHKQEIKANLCRMLHVGIDDGVVNVKAKTHEKVDSIGEGRSVGCHAVVMLIKK